MIGVKFGCRCADVRVDLADVLCGWLFADPRLARW